jgi:phosphatidate cytidylyltransferase
MQDRAAVQVPDQQPSAARPVAVSVAAGIALAGIVLAAILAGPAAFFGLALVVVLVAQAELYGALRQAGHAPATLVGLVCAAVLLFGAFVWGAAALAMLTALPLPLLLAWGVTVPPAKIRSTMASTYLGILYGPALGGFVVLLLRVRSGSALVLAVIGMTAVMDSGAYLIGRKIGRRQMTPRISPGKTWEGLAAGAALSIGLSCAILPFIKPFDLWLAFRLAVVMCACAPLGDLAESLIKRDLGIKDMGSIMPGHGGLMDRIDAALFCAPIAWLLLHVLGWAH